MLKRIIVGAGIAAVGWAAYAGVRRWWDTWGVVPEEGQRALPGDDLIEDALASDTRGITIEAPPELVWPWLLQMGYGRGGWYSIDQLDMRGRSAERIVDAWQQLAVGDIVPTHPGGGFLVKALDPGTSLVLFADSELMAPPDEGTRPAAAGDVESTPVGLAASGAFLSATPKQFKATWTFVVEPYGPRRSRLIERVRYWGAEEGAVPKAALSLLGLGVFVMMQRQMVGIRNRAERLAIEGGHATEATQPAEPAAADANGHAPELAGSAMP